MLVTAVYLGVRGIKSGYAVKMAASLCAAGLFMTGFGATFNIVVIAVFGFLFFASLPVANNCLDYLVRTNIPNDAQGRAWGLIGLISQLGYVVAYALSGVAADAIGAGTGLGVGRGSAIVIIAAGICLALIAISIAFIRSIRSLESV